MAYNNRKKALLLRKEELLKELQYYDKRIEDLRNTKRNCSFYDDDSTDTEDFPEFDINSGPSFSELKLQASMLRTCLHATQELTNLQILESEVNVMVDPPEGVSLIGGRWREVTVECRTDLVPFTMTFAVHTPDGPFAAPSYWNLRVTAIKSAHEKELSKSVLPGLRTPSDAVEVLRSYGRAHRSRRTTLARLAEQYAGELYMETRSEGGYTLKCGGLLQVVWEIQNKWSTIAPFTHRMKFDLEYMDESYIKIISSVHRQLSNPSIDTDERTMMLAKIIDTCLRAGRSMRETTEEKEEETDRDKDCRIMAPPKTLPKKVKKGVKRPSEYTRVAKKIKDIEGKVVNDNSGVDLQEESRYRDDREIGGTNNNNINIDVDKQKQTVNTKYINRTNIQGSRDGDKETCKDKMESRRTDVTSKKDNVDINLCVKQKNKQKNTKINNKEKIGKENEIDENNENTSRKDKNVKKNTDLINKEKIRKENTTENTTVKNQIVNKNTGINKNEEKREKVKEIGTKKTDEDKKIEKDKTKNMPKIKHLSERFRKVKVKENNSKNNINSNIYITQTTQTNEKHDVTTKIAQKLGNDNNVKKHISRTSPRKVNSPSSSPQTSSASVKNFTKTNIPRLLMNPAMKPK